MLGNVFRLSARLCAKSMAVITISMLIVSYYLELVVQLVPCMICELQRYLLFIILFTCCIRIIFWGIRSLRYLSQILTLLAVSFSLVLSYHHIGLLKTPASAELSGSCFPNFTSMLAQTPWLEALQKTLSGAGGCVGVAQWQVFHISLPGWTGLFFLLLVLLLLVEFILASWREGTLKRMVTFLLDQFL